jgi:hypothetical protein
MKGQEVPDLAEILAVDKTEDDDEEMEIDFLGVLGHARHDLVDIEYFRLDDDKYQAIAALHNAVQGHGGVERTLTRLKEARGGDLWQGARMDVRKFILQCPYCQKMNHLKTPIQTNPFTLASYSIMDRVAIDTVGELPEDKHGNKYIIAAIDCFSRYIELYAAPDTTAISAAYALGDWISRYGVPSQVVSDNGTQFVNTLLEALKQIFHFDHCPINPYSHEENGIVERAIREVNKHLRALVFERNVLNDWSECLPLVRRLMNSSVHSAIGVAPATLLFGNSINLDRNLVHQVVPQGAYRENQRYADFVDNMIKRQNALIDSALQAQRDKDVLHIQLANSVADTVFPADSYVLQRYERDGHRPPHKLNTTLRGPHKVVAYHRGRSKYTVRNMTNNKLEDFHEQHLQPFYYDPARVNPMEVAARDKQQYVVQEIRGHRGNPRFSKKMTFEVKWAGYDETSWEPWDNVKTTHQLHVYLANQGLQRLIPKQYAVPPTTNNAPRV